MKTSRTRAPTIPREIAIERRRSLLTQIRLYVIGAIVIIGGSAAVLVGANLYYQHAMDVDNHMTSARDAYDRGDIKTAERALRAATSSDDTNYLARYNLGLLLLKEHSYASAVAQLQRSAHIKGLSTPYLYTALADVAMQRYADAEIEARQADRIDQNQWIIVVALAMADRGLGHATRAEAELVEQEERGIRPVCLVVAILSTEAAVFGVEQPRVVTVPVRTRRGAPS